jgi:hypothetical protein
MTQKSTKSTRDSNMKTLNEREVILSTETYRKRKAISRKNEKYIDIARRIQ